jgi:NitT/TauT family transport system ATP-binding protein
VDRAHIVFDNVAKNFGPLRAVEDVNLSIKRGDVVTLVGPSGCGKSTLLNMTAGLFQPTEGHVRYDGAEVTTLNRRTGYMTQNDHLLPWRTVADNIAVPLEIAGLSQRAIADRVDSLMELVGLKGFETSYPARLSGGMRKRTALAAAAYDPETLLLDEPFAASMRNCGWRCRSSFSASAAGSRQSSRHTAISMKLSRSAIPSRCFA